MRRLRRAAKKLVFDFDDAVFAHSDGTSSSKRARQFAQIVSLADSVWCGNNFLAEQARQYNENVQVLPTAVDMQHYLGETDKSQVRIDLVWIGSRSTSRYLDAALPVLEKAHQAMPALRLKIIADFDFEGTTIPTCAVPWSAESEAHELASAHIGIAPMPDNTWTRGKCALKVLQYMAAGLPVISSNAGANAEVIEHGVTGLLCSSEHDWLTAIAELASKPQRREQLGAAGRQRCAQYYSQEVVSQRILDSLDNIMIYE